MVKTERLELVIEILTSQMNHWILFPLVMTALGISMIIGNPIEEAPDFLLWAVCGMVPIAFFSIRNYVERFWLFVLCHGAVLAAALFAAALLYPNGAVICVVCTVVYIIYSFMLRLRENTAVYSDSIHPFTALGITVAANFMFHREDDMPDWDKYYLFILIGVLACYLIIYYLKHYLNFLQVNRSSAGYLPAKEILHSGIGFVLPYTLIGVLILTLSLNVEWLEPVIHVLKEGLRILLRFIFRLLSGRENAEEPVPAEEDAGYMPEAGLFSLSPGETFWLWEILEYVAIVLFACGCVFVLIKGLKKLIRFVQERFDRKADSGNFVSGQESIFDVREKCSLEKKNPNSKGTGLFQRFTPVERVRRLYKKRVLAGKAGTEDKNALNYMTARECGYVLSLPEMARLYEQARYSDREITAEDVKQMKLACGSHAPIN